MRPLGENNFGRRNEMTIELEEKDLTNVQQMEVAVNGPDGATHLIICTGFVEFGPVHHGTYTFFVGSQISRRQFVGVTASCAISTIQAHHKKHLNHGADLSLMAKIVSMIPEFDDETGQVKVTTEISSTIPRSNLGISYTVNILAELSIH
jgi:hypothetical protein